MNVDSEKRMSKLDEIIGMVEARRERLEATRNMLEIILGRLDAREPGELLAKIPDNSGKLDQLIGRLDMIGRTIADIEATIEALDQLI